MSTTITLTFPDLVGMEPDVNEEYFAMKYLREAMQAHKGACQMYAGQIIQMASEEQHEYTDTSASLTVTVGAIVFPKAGDVS